MSNELKTNDDVIAYFRANAGEVPAAYEGATAPMLLVHTIGRKTGRDHITPMRTLVEGEFLYIFGTAQGRTADPDWVKNIAANPDVEIEIGTERRKVHATLLEDPERTRIWKTWADRVPALYDIAARTARPIPVVRLIPRF